MRNHLNSHKHHRCLRFLKEPAFIILIYASVFLRNVTFHDAAALDKRFNSHNSKTGAAYNDLVSSAESNSVRVNLETINGTRNYRIHGSKKSLEDKHWLDGRGLGMQPTECVRPSHCQPLIFSTCLGAKIPYEYTSLDLTFDQDQRAVKERLEKYQTLKYIPKCWSVIQPFLCAVLAPKCEQINKQDMVYLPSLEMCRVTLEPCRILYNTSYFPEFLRCNETLFPSKCNNDVREMKFNLTGQCLDPLVPAESTISYYPGIEGCGVRCKDPLYTDDEHRQIQKLTAWGCGLCFLANLFVVATFIIDWDNASKYPALIVFYINICFLIACLGWLVQFTPGSREDIVCRKDGTLRHSEPTAGQNLSCVVVFVIVYYFLTAAMVWFVFLTYAWHLRAVGNFQDRIDKKGSYFHLVAWSLPLVLTITTLALSEVDGNSTVGICFVGYLNHSMRAGLLLGPLLTVICVGGYFIVRGMIMLFALKQFANVIKSTLASNKIHVIIVRMGLCAVFTLLFILVAVACHIYEFRHTSEWSASLKQFIICRIFSPFNEHVKCKIEERPSVSILQLHLLCLFGAGIAMSSWCWTPSSLETWKRYIRSRFGHNGQEEAKMPKHKVIAQTWAKRKEFEDKGRLSITLYNTHTDPVGINFDVYDINSSETIEISSTWANYLPKCVKRRMALTLATNSSSQGTRHKSSIDSEISFSVRHVSVESRRNSLDSQVSVKIAEMKTKVASHSSRCGNHRRHNKRIANSKRAHHKYKDFKSDHHHDGRRESTTSVESRVIHAVRKSTYPIAGEKMDFFLKSNVSKRHETDHSRNVFVNSKNNSNTANIAARFITKNGQLILPFLQNQGISSASSEGMFYDVEEEAVSRLNTSCADGGIQIEEIADKEGKRDRKLAAIDWAEDLGAIQDKISISSSAKNPSNSNSARPRSHTKVNYLNNKSKSGFSSGKKRLHNKKHKLKNPAVNKYKQKYTLEDGNADQHLMNLLNLKKSSSCNNDPATNIIPPNSLELQQSTSEMDVPLDVMLTSTYSGDSLWKQNSAANSKTSCDVGIQTNDYEMEQDFYKDKHHEEEESDNDECNSRKEDDRAKRVDNNQKLLLLNGRNRRTNINDELEAVSSEKYSLMHDANRLKTMKSFNEAERLKMLLLP